jgi:hypothetical protein
MPGSHGWGSVGADLADELGHGDSGWCRGRAPHKMGLHFPDEVVLLRMLFCWAPLRHRCVWQRCACAAVGMYGCVCACLCFQCAFIFACRGCAQHPPTHFKVLMPRCCPISAAQPWAWKQTPGTISQWKNVWHKGPVGPALAKGQPPLTLLKFKLHFLQKCMLAAELCSTACCS